jgi:GntR family transcriptional regulator
MAAEPIYRMIADDLRRQIEAGELRAGVQLKTEVELREEYGRAGIHLCPSWLWTQQLAAWKTRSTAPKSNGRVAYQTRPARGWRCSHLRPRLLSHSASRGDDQVVSRHQQRSIDGTPYSMQTTYYPMNFVTEKGAARLLEARDIEGGVVDYLRGLGIDQVGWRDQFILRPPDGNERTFFNLSDRVQVAMLRVQRTGYDKEGNPIRVTVTIYPGDRNQFEMEADKVNLMK